ncbi:hypothetical protein Hanom_Chr12g01072591 [Helianthus anomalus]
MSQWLTRIGGGNLIKKIICSSLTLSHYQQATASSSFPFLLSNSRNEHMANFAFCSSTNAAFFVARHYNSIKTQGQLLSESDDEDGSTLEEKQVNTNTVFR